LAHNKKPLDFFNSLQYSAWLSINEKINVFLWLVFGCGYELKSRWNTFPFAFILRKIYAKRLCFLSWDWLTYLFLWLAYQKILMAEYVEILLEVLPITSNPYYSVILWFCDFFKAVSPPQSPNLSCLTVKSMLGLPETRSQDFRMNYLYLSGKQKWTETTWLD